MDRVVAVRARGIIAIVCVLSCNTTKPMADERSDLGASLESRFGLSGPAWLGTAPSAGSPSYEMSLEALDLVVDKHPAGVSSKVRLPVPCVLQVVRAGDLTAANPSPSMAGPPTRVRVRLRPVLGSPEVPGSRDWRR
ncbi:MAG: hypothetical protein NVS4B10_02150 [Myxococcales bacterium]